MKQSSPHSIFFSSLKQVAKRLKSENPSQISNISSPPPPPPPPPSLPTTTTRNTTNASSSTSVDHFSSPLYLNYYESNNCPNLQESGPPQEFLSHSLEFPPTHDDPPRKNVVNHYQTVDEADDEKDDIEQLMELLGLSECNSEEEQQQQLKNKWGGLNLKSGSSCHCFDGFYSRIAEVKGPKCLKEMERLNGWIKYLLNEGGEDRKEPFKLVHLLLGKAAFVFEDSGDFRGLEFPPTIEEFLQNDPPTI